MTNSSKRAVRAEFEVVMVPLVIAGLAMKFQASWSPQGVRRKTPLTDSPLRHGSAMPLLLVDDDTLPVRPSKAPPPSMPPLRELFAPTRAAAANLFQVTPAWIDAGLGSIAFVLLNAAAIAVTQAAGLEAEGAVYRLLGLVAFVALQAAIGLPLQEWARLRVDPARVDSSPFFQITYLGGPGAGVTFAFGFGIAIALAAQLLGIDWVPAPRPWPEPPQAVELLLIAPLADEAFFRAFLISAIERAGGSATMALLASAVAYAAYQVPVQELLLLSEQASLPLLLFQLLGLFLGVLYQRSGGSLPLVLVSHATFNALVTALRAAQVGSTLPF